MLLAGALAGANGCLIGPQPGFGGTQNGSGEATGTDTETGGGSTATSAFTESGPTNGSDSESGSESGTTGGDTQPDPRPVGYQERVCGFDLDHDGEVGEPEDCRVCDGSTTEPMPGDHAQRVVYVDCDAGVDADGCGSPEAPCATLQHPLQGLWNTEEEAGYQLMVCFHGTCPGTRLELPNGWTAPVTRPKSGSEQRDFEYPGIPTMLVGWDKDADGEYPPVDDDDIARIDLEAASDAFLVFSGGDFFDASHDLEIAHFSVVGGSNPSSHFASASLEPEPMQRIHFHDIALQDTHRGESASPDRPIIALVTNDYMGVAGQSRWLALENMHFARIGGWVFSEFSDNAAFENGPIRLRNITAEWEGCPVLQCGAGSVPAFWRTAGYFEKVEILDSLFDGHTDTWSPYLGDDPDDVDLPATAIVVGACNREFAVVNNEFRGFATAVRIEANTVLQPCTSRRVGDVLVDGNVFAASAFEPMSRVTIPFYVGDRPANVTLDQHVGAVSIVNNAVVAEHGWRACTGIRVSGPGGPIAFDHNTCIGALADPTQNTGHLWVRAPLDPLPIVDDVVVRNSLFAGANAGDVAVLVEAAPAGWRANANAFDPDASFVWSGNAVDFAGWQAMSAGDAASRICVPELAGADDFHLGGADTCAAEQGMDLAEVTHDIDGDDRPMGSSADIGADERR